MMETDVIVTRTATTRLEPGGLIRATTLPDSVQTLADAQENMQAITALSKGQPCALLTDMRQIRSQDRAAREYYTRPENAKNLRAVALLIGSPMSRVIANFFLGFNKPIIPTRLFTSEIEAVAWLQEFQD
jgi:hypothetical protein